MAVADTTLLWDLVDEQGARASLYRRAPSLPAWLNPVLARIVELAELDSVNPVVERPLNMDDAVEALEFLDRVMRIRGDTCIPWVGRLSSGGVQLAWQHADVEVEAVFDRLRGEAELIVSVGDNEWDAPADQGESLFASVVDRLSNSYIGHAPEPAAAAA